MAITNFLTPQVRTFVYGAVAALLSVATVQNWISNDLAKSINDNLPTILGAISSIIAAANVKQKPKTEVVEVVAPVAATQLPIAADRVDNVAPMIGLPQAAAVEEPLTK